MSSLVRRPRAKRRRLVGGGANAIEDWFENTFDPQKNGVAAAFGPNGPVAAAFDPKKNGVDAAFVKFGRDTAEAFQAVGDSVRAAFSEDAMKAAFAPAAAYLGSLATDPMAVCLLMITIAELIPYVGMASDAALIAGEMMQGIPPDPAEVGLLFAEIAGGTNLIKYVPGATAQANRGLLGAAADKIGEATAAFRGASKADVDRMVVQKGGALAYNKARPKLDVKARKAAALMASMLALNEFATKSFGNFLSYEQQVALRDAKTVEYANDWRTGGIAYIKKHDPRMSYHQAVNFSETRSINLYSEAPAWLSGDYGIARHSEKHLENAAVWYSQVFEVPLPTAIMSLSAVLLMPSAQLLDYERTSRWPDAYYSRDDGTSFIDPPAADYVSRNIQRCTVREAPELADIKFRQVDAATVVRNSDSTQWVAIPDLYSTVGRIEERRINHLPALLEIRRPDRVAKMEAERTRAAAEAARQAAKIAQEAADAAAAAAKWEAHTQTQGYKEAQKAYKARLAAEEAARKAAEEAEAALWDQRAKQAAERAAVGAAQKAQEAAAKQIVATAKEQQAKEFAANTATAEKQAEEQRKRAFEASGVDLNPVATARAREEALRKEAEDTAAAEAAVEAQMNDQLAQLQGGSRRRQRRV